MIEISVTIPTLKPRHALVQLIEEVTATIDTGTTEVIASCITQSAAKNRNWCIDNAKGKYVIMIDDDMTGFYKGWAEDLIQPLKSNPAKYNIVSARLLDRNRNKGPQLGGDDYQPTIQIQECKHPVVNNIVCSACIAFNKEDGVRFDEGYLYAVYEDTDFCMEYMNKFPNRVVVINNNCKLIHLGEGKGRNEWSHNKEYFARKWKIRV